MSASGHLGVRPPKKGIRSRIIFGGLAAAYLAELANKGTVWVNGERGHIFLPEIVSTKSQSGMPEHDTTLSHRVEAVLKMEIIPDQGLFAPELLRGHASKTKKMKALLGTSMNE